MSNCKTFFGILLCLFLLQACDKDNEITYRGVEPVELDEAYFYSYFSNTQWLILSSPEGEVLSCSQLAGDSSMIVPDDILSTEGGYHLTIGSSYVNDFFVGGSLSDGFNLVTYTHLKARELKFKSTGFPPPPYTSTSPAVWVTIDATEEEVEHLAVSSDVHNFPYYIKSRERIYLSDDVGDIMVMLKMKDEVNWRFGWFKDLEAASTLEIKSAELDIIPANNIRIPDGYNIEWGGLVGIKQCGTSYEDVFLQLYNQFDATEVATAIPPNIFERFETSLSIKNGNESYQLDQMGATVAEYLPTSGDFRAKDANIRHFELSTTDEFTHFHAHWNSNPNNDLVNHELSWLVWGDFAETFQAPILPDCLTDQFDWIKEKESQLQLAWLSEYNNNTMDNYADYIRYALSVDRNETNCNRYNFNGEGRREIKTKKF